MLEAAEPHGDVRRPRRDLAARFGAERLMWGSDYSQTHDHPYPELAEYARRAASRLDPGAREAFLGGTAMRLWPQLTP